MPLLKSILKQSSEKLWSINPKQTVLEAIEKLANNDLGALLVLENGNILGVFSERDYARKLLLEGRESKDTFVCEVMETRIHLVAVECSLEHCLALMTEKKVRHLPVVSETGILLDFVSMREVVEAMVRDRDFMIEQLQSYIQGSYAPVPVHRNGVA